jgi:hypothetical protein
MVSLEAVNLEGICLAKTLALVTLLLWNFDLSELFHNDVALTSFCYGLLDREVGYILWVCWSRYLTTLYHVGVLIRVIFY